MSLDSTILSHYVHVSKVAHLSHYRSDTLQELGTASRPPGDTAEGADSQRAEHAPKERRRLSTSAQTSPLTRHFTVDCSRAKTVHSLIVLSLPSLEPAISA